MERLPSAPIDREHLTVLIFLNAVLIRIKKLSARCVKRILLLKTATLNGCF